MINRVGAYLVFRVGREWYAVPVDAVIEVLHMVALNEVPSTGILGVMTLRDRLLKVYDLRLRFGVPAPTYRLDTPIIAINTALGAVGLVVDEVDNVAQVAAESISPYDAAQIVGVFHLTERTIFVLDASHLDYA